jgi:ribosomal protein S18 acetylase RimI-like enzyme
MSSVSAKALSELSDDFIRLLSDAPRFRGGSLSKGGIAISGEPEADLNAVILCDGTSHEEFRGALDAIRDGGVDALLIADEDADDLHSWLAHVGLAEVGRLPVMELQGVPPSAPHNFAVRIASSEERNAGGRLVASAFSLNQASCEAALPGSLFASEGIDLWVALKDDAFVGCGIFVRDQDRVGIYTMATAPELQRKGAGGALLSSAMSHYQTAGVTRFILGATEKGFPLYQRLGFKTVASPRVYVVGASTQFSAI